MNRGKIKIKMVVEKRRENKNKITKDSNEIKWFYAVATEGERRIWNNWEQASKAMKGQRENRVESIYHKSRVYIPNSNIFFFAHLSPFLHPLDRVFDHIQDH